MTQRQDSNGLPPNLSQLPPGMQLSRNVGLPSNPTPEQLFNMSSQAAPNLLTFQDLHNQTAAAQQMLLAQQAAARMPMNSQDMPIYDLSSMATSAHVMNSNIPTTATSDLQSGNVKLPGNIQIKQEACPSPPIMNQHQTSQMQMQQQYGKPLDTSGSLDMGPGMSNVGGVAKHICQVCGDKASGKHYGVYSCEGCKGFFKRTVRKDLTYNCRDNKDCVIDKRQRNRCQYCRYHKCLETGMRREAVQEERQKNKDKDDKSNDTPNPNDEMPVDQILQAEILSEPNITDIIDYSESEQQDPVSHVCKAADRQLLTLVEWAKKVPYFNTLVMDDRVALLHAGWNELFIASFSHRSTSISDGILLASGLHVQRESAKAAGVGVIFDRVLTELVSKMRDMKMDKTELGCLRAIVLYNPDARGLADVAQVESLREKVYASLEAYCRSKYPDQPGRFAKLLLRLPALRSIGLKCIEHLFFFKLIDTTPIDKFIRDMLQTDSNDGENSINNQIRLQSESSVSSINQQQADN